MASYCRGRGMAVPHGGAARPMQTAAKVCDQPSAPAFLTRRNARKNRFPCSRHVEGRTNVVGPSEKQSKATERGGQRQCVVALSNGAWQ
jgi:hypothetical protein